MVKTSGKSSVYHVNSVKDSQQGRGWGRGSDTILFTMAKNRFYVRIRDLPVLIPTKSRQIFAPVMM